MNPRAWWGIGILTAIVVVLALVLFMVPAPAQAPITPIPPTLSPLAARIVVTSPLSGATVPSVFTATGKAPGPWYFEASFPIKVVDANNNTIGSGIAQAQSDWMVEGDVPFIATVTVTGYSGPATLVLMRDNPSGMPENDDSISLPVVIQ